MDLCYPAWLHSSPTARPTCHRRYARELCSATPKCCIDAANRPLQTSEALRLQAPQQAAMRDGTTHGPSTRVPYIRCQHSTQHDATTHRPAHSHRHQLRPAASGPRWQDSQDQCPHHSAARGPRHSDGPGQPGASTAPGDVLEPIPAQGEPWLPTTTCTTASEGIIRSLQLAALQ